ncbi:EpsG family protein [Buttiauxella noackiae]|uniref:EpsG family protein n=1 Tax=Buttiauxella noackiae TaxID=82992 RepID=UPI00054E6EBE|nr:EpsG family protein [Buttiauxella noackiae]
MSFIIFSVMLFFLAILENRGLFKLSALLIGLFYSLTFAYGYDWINYYDTFLDVRSGDISSFFTEPGYLLLMQLFNALGFGFPQFTAIISLLMYGSIYFFCKDMNNPSLAFFTLFSILSFFMLTEQVRQGLALCILLWGIRGLHQGNIRHFLIVVFVAVFFHISAIISVLFLFIRKNTGAGMLKFSLTSSLFVIGLLYALYHPEIFSNIPFVGQKIVAYARFFEEKNVGFWEYILGSRLVFIYFFLYLLLFIIRKQERGIYSGVNSVFMLFLSRLSPYLVRVGYFFVPYLVISVDDYMSQQGKGFHTRLNKLLYIIIIFMVSSIPAWNPVYWEGSKTFLTIFSNTHDINNEILRKCDILRAHYDHIVIEQCR